MKDHVKIGDGESKLTTRQKVLSQLIWFIATARNAIVVFICGGIACYLSSQDVTPFKLTGKLHL